MLRQIHAEKDTNGWLHIGIKMKNKILNELTRS